MQSISTQMILPEGTIAYDGTVIPFEFNTRLVPCRNPTVSIVELGKKLLIAARCGDTEQVRELMGKGAPFTTDWLGTSPLHFAASHNHLETLEVLLRAGISRDARTKVDRTPLHMAAYEGHQGVVDILLINGAEVDARDMLQMTPLHWAVQNGHADVVTSLLKNGANPEIVNKFDKTATDIAVETNRLDILQLLQVVTRDPLNATTNLAIELGSVNEVNIEDMVSETDQVPVDENDKYPSINRHIEMDKEGNVLTDSMEILKEHGISFLPHDDSSVVASAVENGHSLVLTEVGKQVLNSTKPIVKIPIQKVPVNNIKLKPRKTLQLSTEQLLAMVGAHKGNFKKIPGGFISINQPEKPVRRVVMNKNRFILSGVPNLVRKSKPNTESDIESITKQLAEARRQAEEYKEMLKRKEAEAERYKRQLQSITQGK